MKSHEFLIERVVNLHDVESKEKYAAAVWDILQKSYEKIGGFKSAHSPEDLVNDTGLWKVVTRDGQISAVNVYKDKFGRKSIASGTNGTEQGKRDFLMVKNEDVKLGRAWAEVSGAPEKILARQGAKPIPNKFAQILTGKEILELNPDGMHYTRLIGGEPHEKIIYGVVNLDKAMADKFRAAGIDMQALPDNLKFPK